MGGREGREGGMTVIHILMEPQYLNNNHVTYYVITKVGVYAEQWYVITSDVTWTHGQSETLTNILPVLVYKQVLSIPV